MKQVVVLTLLLSYLVGINAKFLWFEKAPDPEDRCTTIKAGLTSDSWEDIHPPPDCKTGGLIWYYTTGRIHAHFFIDPTKETDFKLCLTAGEANALYIWFDHQGKYWTPMSFPNYMIGDDFKERCHHSKNGTMDLFFESPWYKLHYVSHVSWEITPLEPGAEPEEELDISDVPSV